MDSAPRFWAARKAADFSQKSGEKTSTPVLFPNSFFKTAAAEFLSKALSLYSVASESVVDEFLVAPISSFK